MTYREAEVELAGRGVPLSDSTVEALTNDLGGERHAAQVAEAAAVWAGAVDLTPRTRPATLVLPSAASLARMAARTALTRPGGDSPVAAGVPSPASGVGSQSAGTAGSPAASRQSTWRREGVQSCFWSRQEQLPMPAVTTSILDLIGNTPLLRLPGERILGKAEFLNPGGSIKDRIALAMIEGAERRGVLRRDAIIVEPTSGNTGIGVALVGRLKGYRVRIVMPEGMSEERKKIIRALGAELVLTPDSESIGGAVERVRAMAAEDPRVFVPQQFENPDNPEVHYRTTAAEIWAQLDGEVDCFVAGIGSGGTLQGVGQCLRERRPGVRIVAVEPHGVSALLGHEPGLHAIQGIGDGFIPAILDTGLIDDVIEVSDEDAVETTRALGRDAGLLVGTSSGANVWAARRMAERLPGNIVTVLPDRAERYFSTALL
jgi:cysteine synthase A